MDILLVNIVYKVTWWTKKINYLAQVYLDTGFEVRVSINAPFMNSLKAVTNGFKN